MLLQSNIMKKKISTIISALIFTLIVLVLGYVMLGLLPMLLFAFGFFGGFILWLLIPSAVPFSAIKVPYFLTFAFFILHKFEERYMDFFSRLSEITGVPVPETDSWLVFVLYACVAAWLLIPYLVKKGYGFGYYLAWTFFAAMGITELAHFVFPLIEGGPYGYFPGVASVILLAPAAWWGIQRLKSNKT